MTNLSADWRRKFRFRIPVRCPGVWGKDSVREALVEATTSTGLQPYLEFSDPSAQAISPDEVILISGGLDSLAGAVDELIGNDKKVALVIHQSSTTVASKQNGLGRVDGFDQDEAADECEE